MSLQSVKTSITGRRVAVVGAGMSGVTLARHLAQSGQEVHLFDKSRGVGGRMATRRMEWVDAAGQSHVTPLDHGVPGFAALSDAFRAEVAVNVAHGAWAPWSPVIRSGDVVDSLTSWVSLPDMPAWCRRGAQGLSLSLGRAVDTLLPEGRTWRLLSESQVVGEDFDHVVLAMPPAQAAVLLAPHRADWAQQAQAVPMLPCWTWMGVTDAGTSAKLPVWDVAYPAQGPLSAVIRNDTKPGREMLPDGHAAWVAHGRVDWTQAHLEDDTDQVLRSLREALAEVLGSDTVWRRSVVHRWRYAHAPVDSSPWASCWWDPALGLGVCGDFLGGADVEGAWLSAQSLARAMAPLG